MRATDFLRDQGVGTWEINLAAFLADLNTNLWPGSGGYTDGFIAHPYLYCHLRSTTRVHAFDDAGSLLRYRYATNWANLASVSDPLLAMVRVAFSNDGIDGYTTAVQLMTAQRGLPRDPDR